MPMVDELGAVEEEDDEEELAQGKRVKGEDDDAMKEAVARAMAEEGLEQEARQEQGGGAFERGDAYGEDPRAVTYVVTRRFRQFQRLHADLKLIDPALARALPPFPEGGLRAFADRFSPRRIAERAKALDAMLQLVCACFPEIMQGRYVRRFLKQNSFV